MRRQGLSGFIVFFLLHAVLRVFKRDGSLPICCVFAAARRRSDFCGGVIERQRNFCPVGVRKERARGFPFFRLFRKAA